MQRTHPRVLELAVDQLGDFGPDAGRLGDLLRRGREQRVERAELRRQAAARDEADALDPDREQHDAERLRLGGARSPARASRALTVP